MNPTTSEGRAKARASQNCSDRAKTGRILNSLSESAILRSVELWLYLAAATIPCIAVSRSLTVSSLWIDELYTVYFSDPASQTFQHALARIAEDVLPPAYYLLIYTIRRYISQESSVLVSVIRGLSAASSFGCLLVLFFGTRAHLSLRSRLFLMSFAATSAPFLYYALEARSYAVSWLFTSSLLVCGLAVFNRFGSKVRLYRPIAALILFGLFSSVLHYYGVLLVGGLIIALLIFANTWHDRIVLVATGALILLTVVAVVIWHQPQITMLTDSYPIQGTVSFVIIQLIKVIYLAFPTVWSAVVPIIVFATAFGYYLKLDGPVRRSLWGVAPVVVLSIAIMIFAGIAITLIGVPSFAARHVYVGLPFVWFIVAFVFDRVRMVTPLRVCRVICLGSAVMLACLSSRVSLLSFPLKSEYRNSAATVSALKGCNNGILPVVAAGQIEPQATYEWYLTEGVRSYLWVSRSDLRQGKIPTELINFVDMRVQSGNPCKLMLWSVHHLDSRQIEVVRTRIGELLRSNGIVDADKRLVTISFPSYSENWIGQVIRNDKAFIILWQ